MVWFRYRHVETTSHQPLCAGQPANPSPRHHDTHQRRVSSN